jgi:hypothetical protein
MRIEELAREAAGGGPYTMHREFISRFIEELGICCFVGSAEDIPMWAYYGESHTGVCLRFRLDEEFLNYTSNEAPPVPVEYMRMFPRPRFYDTTVVDLVTTLISTKAEAWRHEREWRIVTQRGPGNRPFPAALLDGVIVGERISADNLTLVRSWLRQRTGATELLQAHSSDSEFKIELRPIGA